MSWIDLGSRIAAAMLAFNVAVAEAASESGLDRPLSEMHAQRWREAISLLDPAPPGAAVSLDSYLLAVCWYHLGNPKSTIELATRALTSSPPLEQAYVSSARSMIVWASEALSAEQIKIHFEMSIPRHEQTNLAKLQKLQQEDDALLARVRSIPGVSLDMRLRDPKESCADLECATARLDALLGVPRKNTPALGVAEHVFSAPTLPADKQARDAERSNNSVDR